MLKNKKDLENENRLENIKELLMLWRSLIHWKVFEHVISYFNDQNWEGKINMMTMHAAKVLNLMWCFYLVGRGLFPHQKIWFEENLVLQEQKEKL